MTVTDFIQDKINRFSRGYVFSYSDLGTNPEDREATIKALNGFYAPSYKTSILTLLN